MPIGSLEQLKSQPPAEALKSPADLSRVEAARGEIADTASKAEAPSEKIDRPAGVSEPVEQSFSARAKEVAGTLSAESKGFLAKLYERVKSSEIAQNITDRYQVWRNEGLSGRTQRKTAELQTQQETEQKAAESAIKRAESVTATQAELDKVMQSVGKERSAADKTKAEEEIAGHKTRAEEAEMRTQLLAGQMSQEKERLENYQAKAQEARGHLDGRLAAKLEANNKTIEEYDRRKKDNEAVAEGHQATIKEIESNIKTLENFLATASGESARAEAQKTINEFGAKQKVLEAASQSRVDAQVKLQEKTDKLREKNADLQAKRDAIFPPKEKPAQIEQPGAEPKSIEIKPDGKKAVVDFGGGKEIIVSGGQVREIGPNGSITAKPISEALDDIRRYFDNTPRSELEMMGFPQEAIEQMEKAEEERPPFLAGDMVAEWNKKYGGHGAILKLDNYTDAAKDLQTENVAKTFMLERLAKKFHPNHLATGWKKDVSRFFQERESARAAA